MGNTSSKRNSDLVPKRWKSKQKPRHYWKGKRRKKICINTKTMFKFS